jgi:hypothetical protein
MGRCSLKGMKLLHQYGDTCYYCQAINPPIQGVIVPMDQLASANQQGFRCDIDEADPKCYAVCMGGGKYVPPTSTPSKQITGSAGGGCIPADNLSPAERANWYQQNVPSGRIRCPGAYDPCANPSAPAWCATKRGNEPSPQRSAMSPCSLVSFSGEVEGLDEGIRFRLVQFKQAPQAPQLSVGIYGVRTRASNGDKAIHIHYVCVSKAPPAPAGALLRTRQYAYTLQVEEGGTTVQLAYLGDFQQTIPGPIVYGHPSAPELQVLSNYHASMSPYSIGFHAITDKTQGSTQIIGYDAYYGSTGGSETWIRKEWLDSYYGRGRYVIDNDN